MRNLLALIGLLTVVFGGVGWYRGWYQVDRQGTNLDGQTQLQVNIDSKKIGTDAKSAFKQGSELLSELSESREGEETATDGQPVTKPRSDRSSPPASLPGPSPRDREADWGTWWSPSGN